MRRFGVLLVLLVFIASAGLSYLLFKRKPSAPSLGERGKAVTLFTVTQDCPAGIVLTPSLLSKQTVQPSSLQGKPASLDEVTNAVLAVNKKRGDTVFSADLLGRLEEGKWKAAVSPWEQLWWHPITEEQKSKLQENSLVQLTQVSPGKVSIVSSSVRVVDLQPRFAGGAGSGSIPAGILLAVSRTDTNLLARLITRAEDTSVHIALPTPEPVAPVVATPHAPAVSLADLDETFVPPGQKPAPESPPPPPAPAPPPQPSHPPAPSGGGQHPKEGQYPSPPPPKLVPPGSWKTEWVTDYQTVEIFEGGKKKEVQTPLRKREVRIWVPQTVGANMAHMPAGTAQGSG